MARETVIQMTTKTRLTWADVTPKAAYLNRRETIAGLLGAGLCTATGQRVSAADKPAASKFSTDEPLNSFEEITTYNNFYEFGPDKGDPKKYAHEMTTDPWTVKIDGLVDKPGAYDLADVMKDQPLEERIYRLRCVEAWSMVVPWIGFELAGLLNRVGVQPSAKYVAFETLHRPEEMRGQKLPILKWPYVEGLRLDEAMHPLTILATGLYGDPMPNQNGAPIRLVVPWKYGFKSIKSVVRISLTEKEPPTSWNIANSREYGFYSNVNPKVDHPRWSQATERRIGGGLFAKKRPTLMFNGYADHVADMYSDMDLATYF